jgi:tetratricopeptide (TPR) repeat protein
VTRIDQIRQFLESDPDDVFLNFSLGMEYQSAARDDEALALYRKVISLDSRYVAAYLQAGQLLVAARCYDDARAMLEGGAEAARWEGDAHMVDRITQMLAQMP